METRYIKSNLIESFFNSTVTAVILPPTLWIFIWVFQQYLSIHIGIELNQNILQFTGGVRLFAGLIFGITGLVSLTLGSIVWFYFSDSAHYSLSFEALSLFSISYSLVVFFTIKLVESLRSLDSNYKQFKNGDLLTLVLLICFLNTCIKSIGAPMQAPMHFLDMFTIQFFELLVGTMVSFYVLMGLIDLIIGTVKQAD